MYCGQCGTKLPDTSRFCNVCGNQVASSQNPKSEDMSTALSEKANYYNKLAKNGTIKDSDVREAAEFYDKVWELNPDENNPLCELIIWFPIAQTTYQFFHQRWFSPAISSADKAYRNLISDDWVTCTHKPFEELLIKNPDLTPEVVHALCSHFPALSRWLEEKVVKQLLLARHTCKFIITKDEMPFFVTRWDSAQIKMFLDYATNLLRLTNTNSR